MKLDCNEDPDEILEDHSMLDIQLGMMRKKHVKSAIFSKLGDSKGANSKEKHIILQAQQSRQLNTNSDHFDENTKTESLEDITEQYDREAEEALGLKILPKKFHQKSYNKTQTLKQITFTPQDK